MAVVERDEARTRLLAFLKDGGIVQVCRTCPQCKTTSATVLPTVQVTANIKHGAYTFDVVGTHGSSQWAYGLMLSYDIPSNITGDLWYVVRPIEVVYALDVQTGLPLPSEDGIQPKILTLTDTRLIQPCNTGMCMSRHTLARHLGFMHPTQAVWCSQSTKDVMAADLRPIWGAFFVRRYCIRCTQECIFTSIGRPYCYGCYRLTQSEERGD